MELVKVLSFKRVKRKGLNPCDKFGWFDIRIGDILSFKDLAVWLFGYWQKWTIWPKNVFLPLFSQNAKQYFCNLSYISFFYRKCLRYSFVPNWTNADTSYLCLSLVMEGGLGWIPNTSLYTGWILLLFNKIAFFMDQSPIIDDLSPLYWNSALISQCANLVVLPGVNKKLLDC